MKRRLGPPTLEELCGSKKQFRKNDSRQDKVQSENVGSLVQKAGEGTVKVPEVGSLFLSSVSLDLSRCFSVAILLFIIIIYYFIYILFNFILLFIVILHSQP